MKFLAPLSSLVAVLSAAQAEEGAERKSRVPAFVRGSAESGSYGYCAWSPDTSCYSSGWPECCAADEGRDCPDEQPGCNIGVDDCAEMGAPAAELVVLNNWCQPGSPGTSPFRTPDYVAQCKEVATSICEGQIYGVAQRWCADKAMSTSEMLSLQNECEDQVDGMLPGAELALKVE